MNIYFRLVKRYYDRGYYTKANVGTFVRAGKITAQNYEAITGERYADA